MEKLYSVIHSTLVLCLFLGILLLGRTTIDDREGVRSPKNLAQDNKWEGLEVSPPFSWPSTKEMVGLNLLPIFKEKAPKTDKALHQPVSYTQPFFKEPGKHHPTNLGTASPQRQYLQ